MSCEKCIVNLNRAKVAHLMLNSAQTLEKKMLNSFSKDKKMFSSKIIVLCVTNDILLSLYDYSYKFLILTEGLFFPGKFTV